MWPDPGPGFAERRGEITGVERSHVQRGDLVREDLRVTSSSGLRVEIAVLRPRGDAPRPLLVLMAGHETGKEAVELFHEVGERSVAALDYPYAGKHRMGFLEGLAAIPSIQDAVRDTAPAAQLALDALLREPWVDPERIEFVGVSLGALLGPRIAALDARYARVWLVHGAGDLVGLLAHQMRNRIGNESLRRAVAGGFAALLGTRHFAPEQWVARIAPRPLVLLNAVEDERMPRHCVEVLHAGAGAASEIVWMPGAHVRRVRLEVVRELVDFVLGRIERDPLGQDP